MPLLEPDNDYKSYLFLSHTLTPKVAHLDATISQIDVEKYDMLWLGGDLTQATSTDDASMRFADSAFHLHASTTLWALGNHDYSNLERIQEVTNRLPYYVQHRNGLTTIVLDTQDSFSNIVGAQKAFLFKTLDELDTTTTKQVVILHHKLLWMFHTPKLEHITDKVSNGPYGNCFYCLNPNNFTHEIYPKLVEIQQKGIQIICVAGDIGKHRSAFDYQTEEGIFFLAAGYQYDKTNNETLLFSHNISTQELTWTFVPMSDLFSHHKRITTSGF